MRILLTNDDGILATGLAALRAAVGDLGDICVVAPDSPQSAAGRSITLHDPMVCEKVHVDGAFWGWGVGGRPADCVKLAIRELVGPRPDLILAGINAGQNVGVNVFYSGTVAAAAEGALFGIPAVAFSLAFGGEMDFPRAAAICRRVLDTLLAAPLAPGELVNVNVPPLGPKPPCGIRVVPQDTAGINEKYVRHADPVEQAFQPAAAQPSRLVFTLSEEYAHIAAAAESDVSALAEGFITVTSLKSDMTDRPALDRLAKLPWTTMSS